MMVRFAAFLLASAVWCTSALAAAATYSIDFPQTEAAVYEIPFQVAHPGEVVVEVTWNDPRIVALRVEGPSDVISRRSGPSPQRLQVKVPDDPTLLLGRWRLWVRVPAGRVHTAGTLSLTLPDPPEEVAAREAALEPPPPPPPLPDPWTLRRSAPAGASGEVIALFAALEPLRATVYPSEGQAAHDGCGWQRSLTKWLTETRDRAASGGRPPSARTRAFLGELAFAVREVEGLRTSTHPLLAGPVPEDALRRRAWAAARREELRGLERRLDDLAERLRDRKVPELAENDWPSRFVACLTATERHFDERVPMGDEATNRALAEAQWPAFLAAAPALDAVAALGTPGAGPVVRSSSP